MKSGDSKHPEGAPVGSAQIQRPPPGIAPPADPAPPWVRTLDSSAAPAVATASLETSRDAQSDGGYEDDFDEEESSEGQKSPVLELPMDSGAKLAPKTVVERSSVVSAPKLEHSASPSAGPPTASPADSGFNAGLGKLSAIKASVDLYATDSDDEEASKQRFFSQLEHRWRESHDSQDLDYAALNKLLDKVEGSQDLASLRLSLESDAGRDALTRPETVPAPSPLGKPPGSDVKPEPSEQSIEERSSSASSKALLRKSVASTPLASLPTATKKSDRGPAESTGGEVSGKGTSTKERDGSQASSNAALGNSGNLSLSVKEASERASVDLSKLKALKAKQHQRRKGSRSCSESVSVASSVSASEPTSPRNRATAGGNGLAAQFAELQQQMLTMSAQMDNRASARQSVVQQRNHANEVLQLSQRLDVEIKAREAEALQHREALKDSAAREKQQKETYEARLREKQKELTAAKLKLQELETGEPKGKILAGDATVVTLSEAELAALRQEIKEQEQLITGYQQENEAATKQIKEMKSQAKRNEEHLMEEIARLESQLADLKDRGAVTAQEVGTKLKEKLGLEAEIASVKQAAEDRETELRGEIERLRREKRELDAKAGGVDITRMANEDKLVKSITEEMQQLQKQHAADMKEMQEKLAWYAENQEMLTANDELIRQQSETILELERRLRHYEGADGKGNANVKKIKELQKQLQQLQEALTSKNPTSLPALIHAARPSLEESEQGKEMLATIDRLQHQLRAKDGEMERKLRALRQDHEKVRAQYEAKKKAAEQKESRADMRRIKEMEQQLSEVRSFYQKKVKNLTEELGAARNGSESGSDLSARQAPPHTTRAGGNRQRPQENTGQTQDDTQLKRRDERIAELEAQVAQLRSQGEKSSRRVEMMAGERQLSEEAAVTSLRNEIRALQEENNRLKDAVAHNESSVMNSENQDTVEKLKRRVESSEIAIATIQRAHTEAVEKATRAEAAHQKAMRQLHEDHAARIHEVRTHAARDEAMHWETRCSNAEKALRCAESQVQALKQQLEAAESGLPFTPSSAQFRALEAKIVQMEESELEKEKRWQALVEETQQIHGMQAAMQRKKWELALEEKNMEIEGFRQELAAILGAANDLATQQRQGMSGNIWTHSTAKHDKQATGKDHPLQDWDLNSVLQEPH